LPNLIYTTCGVAIHSGPGFYWQTAYSRGTMPSADLEKIGSDFRGDEEDDMWGHARRGVFDHRIGGHIFGL